MTWLYAKRALGIKRKQKPHEHHNQYIRKEAENDWVVLNKSGEVMSHHESREEAEESFRAMEANKHG